MLSRKQIRHQLVDQSLQNRITAETRERFLLVDRDLADRTLVCHQFELLDQARFTN